MTENLSLTARVETVLEEWCAKGLQRPDALAMNAYTYDALQQPVSAASLPVVVNADDETIADGIAELLIDGLCAGWMVLDTE